LKNTTFNLKKHIEHTLETTTFINMPKEELPPSSTFFFSPKFGLGNKLVATLIELGRTSK
jgi:hypothetical protein